MTIKDDFVLHLNDASFKQIGCKGANLKLISEKSNLKIPETLILTTNFFQKIKENNGLSCKNILSYKEIVINKELENKILSEIKNTFNDASLVIRSSATCEDSPLLSFAGQYSTFLNIKGRSKIIKAIKMCLASLYCKNSIFYAKNNKVNLDSESIAILIQRLIPVQKAGVIFTANPVNGNKNQITIEYTDGLGDKVVSGEKKPFFEVIKRGNSSKNKLINKVIDAAMQIEKIFNEPRDIEWGVVQDDIYIFQSRPITTYDNNRPNQKIKIGKTIAIAKSASCGIAIGNLNIIDKKQQIRNIKQNDIIYLRNYSGVEIIEQLNKISGFIFNGGVLSHLSVIAREFKKPALANFCSFSIEKYNNKNIILDGTRGIICLPNGVKTTYQKNKFEKLIESYKDFQQFGKFNKRQQIEGVIFEIDKEKLLKNLKSINASKILQGIQTIKSFDFPDKSLKKNSIVLRTKTINDITELQFKQLIFDKNKKGRKEEEMYFVITNSQKVEDDLTKIGLIQTGIQQRELISYITEKARYNVETWPNTPTYVGIEVVTYDLLNESSLAVGLNSDNLEQIGGVGIFKKYGLKLKNTTFNKIK